MTIGETQIPQSIDKSIDTVPIPVLLGSAAIILDEEDLKDYPALKDLIPAVENDEAIEAKHAESTISAEELQRITEEIELLRDKLADVLSEINTLSLRKDDLLKEIIVATKSLQKVESRIATFLSQHGFYDLNSENIKRDSLANAEANHLRSQKVDSERVLVDAEAKHAEFLPEYESEITRLRGERDELFYNITELKKQII